VKSNVSVLCCLLTPLSPAGPAQCAFLAPLPHNLYHLSSFLFELFFGPPQKCLRVLPEVSQLGPRCPKVFNLELLADSLALIGAIGAHGMLTKRPLEKNTKQCWAKSPNSTVFWKVGHVIRPRLCSPNTLFTFLCFCPKQPPNDFKKLPKIDTNPSWDLFWDPVASSVRAPKKGRFQTPSKTTLSSYAVVP